MREAIEERPEHDQAGARPAAPARPRPGSGPPNDFWAQGNHGQFVYGSSGRSTGGSVTLIELDIDGGPPPHTHTREDESFYVLTGTLEVECGNDRFQAGPGSFVFLPRNLPHVFRSVSGPATALLIVTPGGLDEYFAELSAALAANADTAQVRTIQQAYGIARS